MGKTKRSKPRARTQKKKDDHHEKRVLGQTVHGLDRVQLNDNATDTLEDGSATDSNTSIANNSTSKTSTNTKSSPQIDINTIPVKISLCFGELPSTPFPGIPVIDTTLGEADTYFKVFSQIRSTPEITNPLVNIYNLTTADHKETVICMTDQNQTRHYAPLYYLAEPNIGGDINGTGALLTQWKHKVATGILSHTPQCFCSTCNDWPNGRQHGVEIFEVLKIDGTIPKCLYVHRRNLVLEAGSLIPELEKKCEKTEKELEMALMENKHLKNCIAVYGAKLEGGEDEHEDGDEDEDEDEDDEEDNESETEKEASEFEAPIESESESESESTEGDDGSDYEP